MDGACCHAEVTVEWRFICQELLNVRPSLFAREPSQGGDDGPGLDLVLPHRFHDFLDAVIVSAFKGQYGGGEELFGNIARKSSSANLPGCILPHAQAVDLRFQPFIEPLEISERKMRSMNDSTAKVPKKRRLFGKLMQYACYCWIHREVR